MHEGGGREVGAEAEGQAEEEKPEEVECLQGYLQ